MISYEKMAADFFSILYWWLMLLGIGVIFLPLIFRLFGGFFDKGYPLAKILGILLIGYFIWVLGSLRILPFVNGTIWLVIVLSFIANWRGFKKERLASLPWKIIVGEEILFFLALTFWTFIRGFQPAIQGLEKFMDFGFVNAILRSQFFPPADMWLAGSTINYYYFGHLVSAVLTKLSGLDPAITYNLLLGSLFAFTLTAGFSLGSNLIFAVIRKPMKLVILGGLLSATLLALGGNLHALYWWLTHHNFASYWYPDATRFIVEQFGAADNTIHEFPIYSFVVADLHGHLLNLPFVLLFLGLALNVFIQKKLSWALGILASLLLGVFYITNAWDLPIYFGVLGLVILWINHQKYKITPQALLTTILSTGGILLLAVIFSLPFHLHFRSITSGIALTDFHSPPWMLFVLWGFPLFISLCFVTFLIIQKRVAGYLPRGKAGVFRVTDIFILFLLFIAWSLIIVPEFFYLKDIYIHSYQRANTMFKLTYQSFVMFSLVNGYILVRILTSLKKSLIKFLFLTCYVLLVAFVFVYPYFATRSYYGLKNYLGIYGLNFLKDQYPDDYQAILWLNKNVAGQPVIVEAVGESYTDFARVSANTGLPTILGWRVHEWLWRGSFDQPGAKTEEVRKIYESADLAETQELLNKYQVRYVFFGNMETKAYPQLNEAKFTKLGKAIFRSGQTKIYQID